MSSSLPANPFINSVYPFAIGGNKGSDIPDSTGDINRSIGFGEKFSTLISDGGKFVNRGNINRLFFELFNAVMYLQQGGLNIFDQTLANKIGGYAKNAKLAFYNETYGEWTIIESTDNNNIYTPIANGTASTNVDNGESSKWRTVLPVRDNSGTRIVNGNFKLIDADSATGCPAPTAPDHFSNKEYVDQKTFLGGEYITSEVNQFLMEADSDNVIYTATEDCHIHAYFAFLGSWATNHHIQIFIEHNNNTRNMILNMENIPASGNSDFYQNFTIQGNIRSGDKIIVKNVYNASRRIGYSYTVNKII